MEEPYLTAAEAAALLDVEVPSLYAYVSRGLLASHTDPRDPRARRYRREEVAALRGRREARRHPEQAAPRALAWGEPVLDSALTTVAGGRLWYRGLDAVELARERTLEEVAALLWTGDVGAAGELFRDAGQRRPPAGWLAPLRQLGPLERAQALLPRAASADAAAWDLRGDAVARCGARILRAVAAAVGGCAPKDAAPERSERERRRGAEPAAGPTAAALAAAWGLGRRASAARAFDSALILCADHELNVSTFAARCAASAEATPWDAVSAGLATLRGRRHGGASLRAEALLREAASTTPAAAVGERLRRGEPLPGFGHPLYSAGDPRGAELLALASRVSPRSPPLKAAQRLAAAVADLLGERPNLDLGLAALCAALRLPPGSSIALFALGRTVGWVAHAREEYARGRLIRPRARYVGPPPADARGGAS